MKLRALMAALAAAMPLALAAQATGDVAKIPAPSTPTPEKKVEPAKKAAPPKKEPVPKKEAAPKKSPPPRKEAAPKKDAAKAEPGTIQRVRVEPGKAPQLPQLRDKDGNVIPTDPNAYDVSSATGKK